MAGLNCVYVCTARFTECCSKILYKPREVLVKIFLSLGILKKMLFHPKIHLVQRFNIEVVKIPHLNRCVPGTSSLLRGPEASQVPT